MWNWFSCYLSGRHQYGMWCETGAIFLRCVHCGRRSQGWCVHEKPPAPQPHRVVRTTIVSPPPMTHSRVLPFGRATAQ